MLKMYLTPLIIVVLSLLINGIFSKSVELTFELPDSAVECFYQEIEKNTSAALEYQVKYFFWLVNVNRIDSVVNLAFRSVKLILTSTFCNVFFDNNNVPCINP